MEKSMILKIVVTGPESTGKSTLCQQLAAHYDTVWVPEYARTYLENNGPDYTQDDLWPIAKGQLALEDEILQQVTVEGHVKPVFIDTDLQVIRIWSEFVFGNCDSGILKKIAERQYDLYLLCDTDLPWMEDPLREQPDLRARRKIFHHYYDALVNQPVPWALVSGREEERLQSAILAVDSLLQLS